MNDKEIVANLTDIVSNKEFISEMLDTIEKFKTKMGVYLAVIDITSNSEIDKLRRIIKTANDITKLIDFYV